MVSANEIRNAAIKVWLLGLCILAFAALQGCGKGDSGMGPGGPGPEVPPGVGPGPDPMDDAVVRAVGIVNVSSQQEYAALKLLKNFFIQTAYAATGSSNVTYVNAENVDFAINVASLSAGGFTGDTLSLGSVALADLDDNKLKVCGVGGNQKCLKAIIRVYTTGSVEGFVHQTDGYGAPVYAGSLNPSQAVGLTSANSVQVQTINIAHNKNRIRLSDFPTPTYNVTSDFSNAGAGSYGMTFVVEYALSL